MDVKHDKSQNKFSLILDGFEAYLIYGITNGKADVLTTQVPKELGGKGIGKILMKECADYVKEQGLEFCENVSCSFAQHYLDKNKNS